jgi:hypothetical protein
MKQSYKAALFSALVYPGSGHLMLKLYPMGLLLAGTATGCLGVLVFRAFAIAGAISDRILMGEIPLDIARINEEISMQIAAGGSIMVTIATWLLVICWVAGTADAFRLGRLRDRADTADTAPDQTP